jgi:biopolymer transport protein ExbD
MLLPLIDVMLLLLTFFLISSRIAPYSMISFGADVRNAPGSQAASVPGAARADLLIVVGHGQAELNGAPLPLSFLPAKLEEARDGGARSVIVMTRASATVQDMVSVIETTRRLAFASVTIRRRGSG